MSSQAEQKQEHIRARSHAIWEREGRPDGRAEEHWLRAEREIEAELRAVRALQRLVPPHPVISTPPVHRIARREPVRRAA